MSKSLKNFITIKGALEAYSPAQIRFLFLLRRFSEPMEYSENTLAAAADLERRFAAFGTSLATRLREAADATSTAPASAGRPSKLGTGALDLPPSPQRAALHKWGEEERSLHATLVEREHLLREYAHA